MQSGNILSNFRTRTIPNTIVESDITGEIQTVEEFLEFPGIYGFRLNEVPRTDLQGIITITRNQDNQIFSWSNSDTPTINQYGFDYNNPLPIVYLPSSEVGKSFTIAYKGTGGAYTPKNIITMSALSGDLHERLINSIRNYPLNYSLVNQNIFTYNKILTINNLTITGTCTIRTNNPNSIGILEILGDLTLANFAVLKTIRVILVIHGSIIVPNGTAEIVGQNGFNGGNGEIGITGNSGGGGAGTSQNGFTGVGLIGGIGGYCLIDQGIQTNALQGVNSNHGNGGGGGYTSNAGGTSFLGGGSGGGAGGTILALPTDSGVQFGGNLLHGSGGRGSHGQAYPGSGYGLGGRGGGSGGSSPIIICLTDISLNVTIRAGKNGLNGTVGHNVGAIQPYSGNIVLYSRYANADIPATLDVSPNGAGFAGTIYREKIGASSKMTGYILNNLLEELTVYGVTDFGMGNKLTGDV